VKSFIFLICLFISISVSGQTIETKPVKHFVPLQTEQLSRQEVFWIYSLKTRFWDSGQRIIVYHLDFDHPVHKDFVRVVLHSTPTRFENSVNTYINLGTAAFFRRVNNEAEMFRAISITPGSVGYVSSDVLLINEGTDRVKTVRISN